MSAFTILGFAVAIVLLSVILYFVWRAYARHQQEQAATQPQPATATAPAQTAPDLRDLQDRLVYAGLPRALSPGAMPLKVLKNKGYIAGYSEQRKNPVWVAYRVFNVGWVDIGPRPQRFSVDERTTSRVRHEDYSGSGYDRGHMAPNHAIAKCYGQQAQLETFLMTNICPQRPKLNQEVWETLERLEADVYPKRFSEVWVIDGPVFGANPKTIGVARVQVPDAFYKILLEAKSGRPRTMQVIMPQTVVEEDRRDLGKFLVTIGKIKDQTNIEFFPDMPPQDRERLETATPAMW